MILNNRILNPPFILIRISVKLFFEARMGIFNRFDFHTKTLSNARGATETSKNKNSIHAPKYANLPSCMVVPFFSLGGTHSQTALFHIPLYDALFFFFKILIKFVLLSIFWRGWLSCFLCSDGSRQLQCYL